MTASVNGSPATAWCPNCGDTHSKADGKCTRCGAAAVQAPPAVELRPVANGQDPPADLPPTSASRRWLAETEALRNGLRATRGTLERRIKDQEAQLARLDRAIDAIERLLRSVRVEASTTPGAHGTRSRRLVDRWSFKHVACIECGTTDSKHKAHGYCSRYHGRQGRRAALEATS